MDLEKMMASYRELLNAAAANAPLISTDTFVPPASKHQDEDKNAARRMIAAFVYWLVMYHRVSNDVPPERVASLTDVTKQPEQFAQVLEQLGDRLFASDVQAQWQKFASAYLAPGKGGLGDDYFKLFVEFPGKYTMRDALPTRSDYERLAQLIESRASRFQRNAGDWNQALEPAGIVEPAIWNGGSKDVWLQRLATYKDLLDSAPGLRRTRLKEYWSLVDAAPALADPKVAAALVKTYFWVDDSSIQESVYRALGAFPAAVAMQGILTYIVELESQTSGGDAVVDVFPDDLEDAELAKLAEMIDAAPAERQVAYLAALKRAARNGSRYAARQMKVLDT